MGVPARSRKVPEGAVERLCDYLRVLTMLSRQEQQTASSEEIGAWAGVKASQVARTCRTSVSSAAGAWAMGWSSCGCTSATSSACSACARPW